MHFGHYRDALQLLNLDQLKTIEKGIYDPVKIITENLSVGVKAKDNLLKMDFL